MWISEKILYSLAKLFYRHEIAHSNGMKRALSSPEHHAAYRSSRADAIVNAATNYGVAIAGRSILDLGCNTGSISSCYLSHGASEVVGVDIDGDAIRAARQQYGGNDNISFHLGTPTSLPLPNDRVDSIICHDVFEHVAQPDAILSECLRVLKVGGTMLVGTWGWHHPFAPHLWSTMPVPWAHVLVSERTLLRTCRRVYRSPWYVPNMHDLDADGTRLPDKYSEESISRDYLNKFLITDFETVFRRSGFNWKLYAQPFGSPYARWTKMFLNVPWIREFVTSFIWVVLQKPKDNAAITASTGTIAAIV